MPRKILGKDCSYKDNMRTLERKVQEYMKDIAMTKMFCKDEDGNIEVILWKDFQEQVLFIPLCSLWLEIK